MKFSTAVSALAVATSVLAAPAPGLKRDDSVNDFITLLLHLMPDIDVTIADASDLLTALENGLSFATGDSDTYNDLGGDCTDYTVIFARGTSEPGNTGILVGPPFFDALSDVTDSVTIQGVNNYAASVDTFIAGGDPNGMSEM